MPDFGDRSQLKIGAIVFPRMDQIDFTGPFEVLSRVRGSSFDVLWKQKTPILDIGGLVLTPQMTFSEAPRFDLLVIPGGYGQEELMDDEVVLSFIREQAASAKCVFSVCTGALLLGAAGLLKNVRATTHWASFHLLPYFGAKPVDSRVVVDGKYVSAAGVTAGIDGALTVVSLLCGRHVAEEIQLLLEYAPEPPFNSGSPKTAPPEVFRAALDAGRGIAEARLATAIRVGGRLGIEIAK